MCHFIVESIKERYALFHFVDAEQLSDEAFEELINYYSKQNSSEKNQIRFFDFLPSNLTYIKKLKEKQKLLETKIQDLEKINEDIKKENEQHKLQNDELKIINQQLEAQMKEEINRKNQEIDEMKKTNQQIETQYKEELSQKNQEIDKMKKTNQQIEIQYKEEFNLKVQEIKNNEELNKISLEDIKELLKRYGNTKISNNSDISVLFKAENQYFTGYLLSLKLLNINTKSILF